jgi:hypothetical protein
MKTLSYAGFYGYCLYLMLIGLLGIMIPKWSPLDFEVYATLIFKSSSLHGAALSSAVSQYRFMKALELGFGLFGLLFVKEVFSIRKFNRFFLGILFLGATSRLLSYMLDGRPYTAYLVFMLLEYVIGTIVFIYTRPVRKESMAPLPV